MSQHRSAATNLSIHPQGDRPLHYPSAEERLREVAEAKRKADAETQARLKDEEARQAARDQLVANADASLKPVVESLCNTIKSNIDTLDMSDGSSIRLEEKFDSQAKLYIDAPTQVDYKNRLPFDVLAGCDIRLEVWSPIGSGTSQHKMTTISRTLWFGDIETEGEYRWYEVGIKDSPIVGGSRREIRTANIDEANVAFSNSMTTKVVGACHPIDDDDMSNFVNQWAFWFAQVAGGKLARDPSNQIPSVEHRH